VTSSVRPAVSLVVICHEMARELPRTLTSVAPPYQRDIEGSRIEIIVVDNGSSVPPADNAFSGLGAGIRILSVAEPTASPVSAINLGLAEARADLIGVWIDGARLASPGLIGACLRASALHPRPVIATLNYQLGPSLQYLSVQHGYGAAAEDALLDAIRWPAEDGYRLFEVATCELRGGPTGPMLESNGLFLPRTLWRELGGYDAAFVEPGGGVVNPDTLIRACALPGTQLIRILGEGTFHQYHGGLSTSTPESAIRTLQHGSRAYLRRRGKPLQPVRSPGWLFDGPSRALLDTAAAPDRRSVCQPA
jgi:glycosyltransferase involved in cell wall biosynthesis